MNLASQTDSLFRDTGTYFEDARVAVGLATALGLGGAARLVRLTLASNRIGPEGVAALRGVGASRAELSIALSLQLAEVAAHPADDPGVGKRRKHVGLGGRFVCSGHGFRVGFRET